MSLLQWLLVAIGGASGALFRCWVGLLSIKRWGLSLPIGTLIVNVLGSFLIGFTATFIAFRFHNNVERDMGSLLIVGFLGAFTTFSSFSLETLRLFERGDAAFAAINVMLNIALCLFAVMIGQLVAKFICG